MNKKFVKVLFQELPLLVSKGVLTEESADRLRKYYETEPDNDRNTLLIMAGVAGALLIGLGIILLLGHNWSALSRPVRAVISIGGLIAAQAVSFFVILKERQSDNLKESVALFWALMAGAAMALISQTYNIPGDTAVFILTWMFLILPIPYLMKATVPMIIYVAGITAWAMFSGFAKFSFFWLLLLPAIPYFLWVIRREDHLIRSSILSFVMASAVALISGIGFFELFGSFWVVVVPSVYAVFYFLSKFEFEGTNVSWQHPLSIIGRLGLFYLLIIFTFRSGWDDLDILSEFSDNRFFEGGYFFFAVIGFCFVAASLYLYVYSLKREKNGIVTLGALPSLVLAVTFLKLLFAGFPAALVFNIFLFLLSLRHMAFGLRTHNLREINIGISFLFVLIAVRFFDVEISFIAKGIVFIIMGIMFLCFNFFFARRIGGVR